MQIGQTSYRGRRGNRPFRRGRSHYGHHGSRPDGPAPSSFRGRGRGQGGSKHFVSHGAVSTNPDAASVLAEGVAALTQQPSASVPGQAPLPAPEQVPPAPFWRPPRMAWCELCRVDCTTPEILEQHKNGKKHKKNLQVFEELQKLNKVNTGQQNAQMSNTELKPDIDIGQSKKVEGNQPLAEKTSEVMTNDNSNETEQQCAAVDNSEDLAEPEMKHKDRFPARGRGSKRKMRGGRGGKYMRGNEGSRRPVEPPKPKVVVPLICELCNVKCESQVVFDSHLSGKKHQSNLKRFHGHRALYGEAALQALYPPNLNAPSTSATPQVQPDVNDPQVLLAQLLMNYVLSQTQAPGTVRAPPTTALASAAAAAVAAITGAPGSSYGTQNQPDSQTQGSELTSNDCSQNALVEITKGQLQSLTTQSEATPTGDIDIKTVNETSTIAVKNVHVPLNNTNMVPGQNSGACEQVSGMVSVKTLSSQQSEVVFSEPEEPTP
ncbi:Zinc finger, U1-type [Trema orientale]|uniref:Zinc finger, U1-type n=1 Tax=Trema orientale TaxID=63057 RepID=A0A2P5EBQ9_TREOI|nr:Zinc finger, U1-type [Trema orientale]